MDKETQEKALKSLEREKARYKRQNAWNAEKYDRVSVTLPKGTKKRIMETGESANAFLNAAVMERLERIESTPGPVPWEDEETGIGFN